MGIWNHIAIDCDKRYEYHSAASPTPPEDANDIKSCGCYTTYDFVQSERSFDYTTKHYITYNYCEEHMKEVQKVKEETKKRLQRDHQENMKQLEKEAKEKEKSEQIWQAHCMKVDLTSDVEINWLVKTMHELNLLRLREIKKLPLLTESGWFVQDLYRGKVILSFYGTHSQFCPVKNVELECCHLKNRQCICIPTINLGFHYSRCKPGNKYIFSLQKDTGSRIAGLKERNILLCKMRELRVTDLKELEKIELFCNPSQWRYVIENEKNIKTIFNSHHCSSCPYENDPKIKDDDIKNNTSCTCLSELSEFGGNRLLFKIIKEDNMMKFFHLKYFSQY